MLPSTGYFKGLNCPFYDSGLCERPYCHFRHVKKDLNSISTESGVLQKLVSEAVKKVLEQTDGVNNGTVDSTTVSNDSPQLLKATYNPTPIAELTKLNKSDEAIKEVSIDQTRRHIPVPYTPFKPQTSLAKKPLPSIDSFDTISSEIYNPGSKTHSTLESYTPQGNTGLNESYKPGENVEIQQYKPPNLQSAVSNINYVPSDKSKRILEYKPAKVNTQSLKPTLVYQPTPRSLAPCFSSDEDEPQAKKHKGEELNDLDDLGTEFDIIGQILDEEKVIDKNKVSTLKDEKKTGENNTEKNATQAFTSPKESKHDKTSKETKNSPNSDRNMENETSVDKQKHKSKHKYKDKEKSRDSKSKYKEKHRKKSPDTKKHTSSRHSQSSDGKKYKSSSSENKSNKKDSRKEVKVNGDKSHKTREKSKHKQSSSLKKHNNAFKDKSHIQDSQDMNCGEDNDGLAIENEEFSDESEINEEAIAMECKKIFEEYVPIEKNKNVVEKRIENEDNDLYDLSKKRVSHRSNMDIKITNRPSLKPDFKISAAQQMAQRLSKVKDYHLSKLPDASVSNPIVTPNVQSSSKIRIAHVPYASTLFNAKKAITNNSSSSLITPVTSTTVQTVKKGIQRTAHVPNEKFIDRPGVLEPLASKIPANIRSTYLNMMIDECIKIYLSVVDGYARAQHEELNVSKKCKTIQIYKNSALLTVNRLRKELQECNGVKKSSECTNLLNLKGNSDPMGSWSILNKSKKDYDNPNEYHGANLYLHLQKWILTEEQLRDNGFPRSHPKGEKGLAVIYAENKNKPPKGNFRNCCRCNKEFTVDKKGLPTSKEECVYHPNRKYRYRGEVKYQCCSQDGMSDGCCVAPSHVYEYLDFNNLKGYVKTMSPTKESNDYGVYSLDCEMCYTTHGLDLTRITVIDSKCKVIYETLIRPLHPIIDYNTRYSGITEEQMTDVKTTLLEVQATLLSMFTNKTILIGHSLESDFKALKLIHDTVIDTSVLYPHKMGPPYKRALRNLSSEYLKKIIQNSVEGHDSAEDATVCMQLIHYKLREDLKVR